MTTTAAPHKRPRIQPSQANEVESMRPSVPFERAVNDTIVEAIDARAMLAECILDLEGDRGPMKAWTERRNELALKMDAVSLVRILKLRLRDHGVEL